MDDFWMAVVLLFVPAGFYLGIVTICPVRPTVRKDEHLLRWISDRLWWLLAINGLMWAGAHLLVASGWLRVGISVAGLSVPIFVGTTTCGMIAYGRYLIGDAKQGRGRRS